MRGTVAEPCDRAGYATLISDTSCGRARSPSPGGHGGCRRNGTPPVLRRRPALVASSNSWIVHSAGRHCPARGSPSVTAGQIEDGLHSVREVTLADAFYVRGRANTQVMACLHDLASGA
jgi:hypothetical protein